jgi:hypothetical protein
MSAWLEISKPATMSLDELRHQSEGAYQTIAAACSILPLANLNLPVAEKVEAAMKLVETGFLRIRIKLAGEEMRVQWRILGKGGGWEAARVNFATVN